MYFNLALRFFAERRETDSTIALYIYIYTYIYVCVCACVRKVGSVAVTDSSFCSRWGEKKFRS